ncbi:MAG: hypothetical protein ACI84D_002753 [Thalassolituus oleivorans]|jgi:hypothetical protein
MAHVEMQSVLVLRSVHEAQTAHSGFLQYQFQLFYNLWLHISQSRGLIRVLTQVIELVFHLFQPIPRARIQLEEFPGAGSH